MNWLGKKFPQRSLINKKRDKRKRIQAILIDGKKLSSAISEWMWILFYLIEIIESECTLWLSNKIHYAIIHITKQITFFTYSHIYTHAYIGEYTCTHKEFLYSLILYLYANVSSTVRSAPSFSHATLKNEP